MGDRKYSVDELPVTLLVGSLGAGKTTLLNYILSQNHGKRIAVVENEFGEIPVDHDLIVGADQDIFEMSNGCICCSVRTDLIETLGRLLTKQDRFDYILIEATGLASPGPIAQAFLVEEAFPQALKLDGVVTLIDCVHLDRQLKELEVTWEQIAFSNILLLNKIDQAGENEVAKVEAKVRAINPTAQIFKTTQARVDLEHILNLGGFELGAEAFSNSFDQERPASFGELPESDVTSVSLEMEGEIDENQFQIWLQMLLITEGIDVFRAKGVLNLSGSDKSTVFQSVYMMYDSQAGSVWKEENPINRIVFIGRHLDRDRLEAGVRSCLSQ